MTNKTKELLNATYTMKNMLASSNGGKLEYGAITEQGDLGLGFNVLNESDQEIMNRKRNEENK